MISGKNMTLSTLCLSTVMLCFPAYAQHVLTPAEAERYAQNSFPEYLELLTLPNDASVPSDIQRNADWLEKAFQKRGFTTKTLANGNKPLVYAEWGTPTADRKTILFYMHFDGQPVYPAQWQTPPWQPVLKEKEANGKWRTLPESRLLKGAINPEWRLYARASADDKGPIMMFLAAMDAMKDQGVEPAINIKVLLDAEEEKGSPSLTTVMAEHRSLLKSDGMVIYDGAMPSSNRPGINFGNRGSIQIDMTVFGANAAAHSGGYGNVISNPVQKLVTLLASMKDANGRVTIPGYYDRVTLSNSDKQQVAQTAPPPGALEQRFGVAQLDKVADNAAEALQYPSLDILGLNAGGTGKNAANAIPATATASLNIRTVPETPPEERYALLRQYITEKGFHIIAGESPTADERERYPHLISLHLMAYPSSSQAARTEMDSPLGRWAVATTAAPRGIIPEKNRMMGGTLPMSGAVSVLKVPYVIVPLVNADNNQHSFDENLRLGNYLEGIRTIVAMATTPLS
ncbi:M20/M25/M40 family metallo-hydrolase [Pectobacterium cacticida]|uniref:M20/M25/M40 family metallo-hydrolase n=1 Tax=Pectobacterium cacticida TaxID=69221 RepID=A0ABZ2G7K9_9GAMM|nr:M20/M25/M40 family metallo-hydrolase [Pectobacterium cacticida]UYX08413.1 M20/M25/M40 family metallo-hydrolase [Pectobacterium cacticida]